LAIRIEYKKQLLTVLTVSSCFLFDFDCGWRETGFLRDTLLRWENLGKNPVSKDGGEWPETGFLRDTLLRWENFGKNPVSKDSGKNPVSGIL
ncbi:MAG: hypothetical protein LH628_07140, partial [Microcoleus sp. CAN_BIN18]|nr:hypothetical protein [Microcoleus sp. CAN_BIN18]